MTRNVIWSRPIKEIATTTTTTQGGKGGGGASSSTTEFSYFVTLAIAICEGEVDMIERVWADAKQLELSQGIYRFYNGTEDQLPDTLIESFEGVGNALQQIDDFGSIQSNVSLRLYQVAERVGRGSPLISSV